VYVLTCNMHTCKCVHTHTHWFACVPGREWWQLWWLSALRDHHSTVTWTSSLVYCYSFCISVQATWLQCFVLLRMWILNQAGNTVTRTNENTQMESNVGWKGNQIISDTCLTIILGYVLQFVINVIVCAQWKVNNVYLLTVKCYTCTCTFSASRMVDACKFS